MRKSIVGICRAIVFVIVAVVLSAAQPVLAAVVGYRSILDLVSESDVILVGEVASVRSDRGGQAGSIVLLPTEILKGTIPSGPIELSFEGIALGGGGNLKGKRALAFGRRRSASEALQLVPILDGEGTSIERQMFISGSIADSIVGKSPQDTPLQRVIKELATIQAQSNSTEALAYLVPLAWSGTEAQTSREAFRAMRDSGSQTGFTQGTTGLVALGDLEGLESLEAADPEDRNDLDGALQMLESFYGSTDQRGIQILADWLRTTSPPKMRIAAAGALARIHTPAAVALLGPALTDSDFEVRWRAIGGLSMFANNVPIGGAGPAPADWPFRTDDTIRFSVYDEGIRENESYYLDFWESWWRENQDAVEGLIAGSNR